MDGGSGHPQGAPDIARGLERAGQAAGRRFRKANAARDRRQRHKLDRSATKQSRTAVAATERSITGYCAACVSRPDRPFTIAMDEASHGPTAPATCARAVAASDDAFVRQLRDLFVRQAGQFLEHRAGDAGPASAVADGTAPASPTGAADWRRCAHGRPGDAVCRPPSRVPAPARCRHTCARLLIGPQVMPTASNRLTQLRMELAARRGSISGASASAFCSLAALVQNLGVVGQASEFKCVAEPSETARRCRRSA